MNNGNMPKHNPFGHPSITQIVVPVIVFMIATVVITAVSVGVGCWCYHRKKRKRQPLLRTFLTGKGGIIVLSDDLNHASNEGRLVVNVSLLDGVKVKISELT